MAKGTFVVRGVIRQLKRGERPGQGLPWPERPVDPGWGVEEGELPEVEPPEILPPEEDGGLPTHPIVPPGLEIPIQLPIWGAGKPSLPIELPEEEVPGGGPEQPIYPPPGAEHLPSLPPLTKPTPPVPPGITKPTGTYILVYSPVYGWKYVRVEKDKLVESIKARLQALKDRLALKPTPMR